MNKILILALCVFYTNPLFCAEAIETAITALHTAETILHAAAAALCVAKKTDASTRCIYKKRQLYGCHPNISNSLTQKDAAEHEALRKLVGKIGDPAEHTAANTGPETPYYDTFLAHLRNETDIVISAYEYQVDGDSDDEESYSSPQFVGGLFGTKHKGPNKKLHLKKGQAIFQIDSLYVDPKHQRKGVGTDMVRELESCTENLPLIVVLEASNETGRKFWESLSSFQLVTDEDHPTGLEAKIGWDLLTASCPQPPYKQEDIVTYYSDNCPAPASL